MCMFLGLHDWDLGLKAKTDGTFGLEGLKYEFPEEIVAGTGQSQGQNSGEESNSVENQQWAAYQLY